MPEFQPALQIGHLRLKTAVMLAPMAGYTDCPFRQSLRAITPRPFLAYSEMIEPHSVLRGGGQKRQALLAHVPDDVPLAWQLYGTDPDMMAEAAQWLIAQRGAALLDINMGCPKRKITRRGAGAGLLQSPELALTIARRVAAAAHVPVTAKLRLGWNKNDETALRLAPALEQSGLAALTIHGRTGLQGYTGRADRAAIRKIVAAVPRLPIIANGDICTPEDAVAVRDETGCAAVMIGRAALHNPWLIGAAAAALDGSTPPPEPTRADRCAFLADHFRRVTELYGERIAPLLFRRWIPQYAKTFRIPRDNMLSLLRTRSIEDLRAEFARLDIHI
ncbi:MAG: tRNA dihydrouridine synthase [Kiritimatiellia bacterium]|jgi:tRNA-dihydrouridine synthase B